MNSLAHTTSMFRRAIWQFWRSLAAAPLGEPAPPHIPPRLRGVIEQEHRQGELLIAWAQGALLLIWSALYALSPKALPSQAPFQPVPWTLAAYGAFILVRLMLIYRDRLADWYVALSIIVDIGVLMLLIWSFHLQYGQPPAFYLKAPTLLYVFIFIALRTLSFEARWVLLAGAVSAAGWGGLLLYAIAAQSDNPPVTHDYVHYMTSSSILLGAELDKIVSILMVTAVLALALWRTRQLVLRCVVDHAAANELSRFVARGLAQRIARAETPIEPGQAELRSAAALVIDLRDFTRISRQLSPEAVMQLLGEYQKSVIPLVQQNGGFIDKFLGDGILASFGAVTINDTYAADALRAVDAIASELEVWRATRIEAGLVAPSFGLAVSTGDVLFGAVGDRTRLEYTIIGDAVNFGARLEKHSKIERATAVTDSATFELARSQGYASTERWRYRLGREIAGVDYPVDLAVLVEAGRSFNGTRLPVAATI